MRITTAGLIGIGTNTPNYTLEVAGTLGVVNTGSNVFSGLSSLFEETNTTRRNRLVIGGDASGAFLNATWSSGGTGVMRFQTEDVERMRINAAGKVAIGTTESSRIINAYESESTAAVANSFWNLTYAGINLRNTSDTLNTLCGVGFYGGSSGASISAIANVTTSLTLGDLAFYTGGSGRSNTVPERMRITSDGTLRFDSGYGSVANAYGCRAWVNFNGSGTPAIRGSGNVSSITDNGTGDYTINFTTAMPDANYSVSGIGQTASAGTTANIIALPNGVNPATSSVRIRSLDQNVGFVDPVNVCVSIFR
jgi:hypothetical protein